MNSSQEPERGVGTATSSAVDEATEAVLSPKWQVLVWDDPINLMSYVEYVFMKHFGFDRAKARERMLAVHNEGKAIVATGSKERAEADVQAMHGYGLHATMRPEPR